MNKLIVILAATMLAFSCSAREWNKTKYEIHYYPTSVRLIRTSNDWFGDRHEWIVFNEHNKTEMYRHFIFRPTKYCEDIAKKHDCEVIGNLRVTTIPHLNDYLFLTKNKAEPGKYTIYFARIQNDKVVETKKILTTPAPAEAEQKTVTNTITKVEYVTNTVSNAGSPESSDVINFKFHRDIIYE